MNEFKSYQYLNSSCLNIMETTKRAYRKIPRDLDRPKTKPIHSVHFFELNYPQTLRSLSMINPDPARQAIAAPKIFINFNY